MMEPELEVHEATAQETSAQEAAAAASTASMRPVSPAQAAAPPASPLAQQPCPTCGSNGAAMPASYVYALGRIEPRFPRLSVEKEFAQATGRAETVNLTDRQALQRVLQDNRYLAKQLCWVMTMSGLETYIVVPRDPTDLNLLVETLRPSARPGDVDLLVGMRGPLAPPEMCNGLVVPIVAFDQLYSFDRDSLIGSIPRPERVSAERFREAAAEVFDRIIQTTDNAGATDDVEKQFLRVDVTEEFPFLVTKLSPYFDR